MTRQRQLLLSLFLIFGLSGVINAATFDETLRAAQQGDAEAQYNLGNMYRTGEGVPQNDTEAMKWFRLSAEQGYAAAQFTLGSMYFFGEGVPENNMKSYVWFSLAKANWDEGAWEAVEEIKSLMTAEQIAKGQELAARCFKSNYKNCD